ncbi:Cas1p 10 TM acyl transferase domain-containing protein [Pelagophyceae sp. CCMP2097]|nr:Cas1p 10 TM acyl transferase domain-containing protein [Pelagophyceae sp. CCMP2097]
MAVFLAWGACLTRVLDASDATTLNRAQTNEWKGWMQIAFVAYHYANAQQVYVPIRWFVFAYVWLTGFGNTLYCWQTSDYSNARFLKSIWRINLFVVPLSLVMGTPWIAYYVVALHTVHFFLLFGCFKIVDAVARRGRRSGAQPAAAGLGCKVAGLALLVFVDVIIWEAGIYASTVGPALESAFGSGFERYFWMRTKMDYLSSAAGAACALALPAVKDALEAPLSGGPSSGDASGAGDRRVRSRRLAVLAAAWAVALCLFGCGVFAWARVGNDAAKYRNLQPFVGTLWIPLYALLRNCHPILRRSVSMPLEWVGARSLELYLLQFHLVLSRQASSVLWLLPDERWPGCNLIATATLWVCAAHRAFHGTDRLRSAAERAPARSALALGTAAVVYAALRLGAFNACLDAPAALPAAAFAFTAAAPLLGAGLGPALWERRLFARYRASPTQG